MKKNKKIRHYIEYAALKYLISFLHIFSVNFAKKIGFLLADFAFIFVPVRKKHIIDCLTKSFPGKNKKEILKIAKDVYKQFVCTIVEIIFVNKMSDTQLKESISFRNLYLIENAVKSGNGGIILSGHYCNWELLAISFGQRYPLSVIVARQENELVDNMINNIRSKRGYNTIYKDNMAYRYVLKALRKNEFVAILADQHAGRQGIKLPFFFKDAFTAKGPAVFALRGKCPVYTAFCTRLPDGKYTASFEEIEKPDTGDEEKDVEIIMSRYNEILRKNIEAHPSYWFWFHRRWKDN